MFDNLLLGFATVLSLHGLTYTFGGVLIGNIIGVLPGIGSLAGISMLLPLTYKLDPTGALMMLAGIFYGVSFGGATTSILLNLPGSASHAVTCMDGHPLARKGKAGPAIFMAMFASSIGVTFSVIMMTFFSPLLVSVAFQFGAAEYFGLMLLGLLAASTLAGRSALKGIAAVILGLIFGVVGTDVNSGLPRFTFGIPELMDGLSVVALALAFFGVKDVLQNAGFLGSGAKIVDGKVGMRAIRPGRGEVRRSVAPIARGAGLGAALGALPGAGGVMAAFMSYAIEKKVSRNPERFGKGAIEGVAGPEAANSSASIAAFIPTLTLGIPGDAVMALMMGALMIHNIVPGPQLIVQHPTLFWGLVASFWLGNAMLLLLNIPLIGMWVKLLRVPYRLIYPVVLFLVAIGVYSGSNHLLDVGIVVLFGVLGYVFAVLDFHPAPMIMGFVLGPLVEENFRRALVLARGDVTVFFTRPLSGAFMAVIIILLAAVFYRQFRRSPKRTALP